MIGDNSPEPEPDPDRPFRRLVHPPLPKSCIFCGERTKLSKEDFFPKWFRCFYPATPESQKARLTAEVSWFERDAASTKLTMIVAPSRMARPGDLADQTLKVVCEPCNNGWMSRLQEAAKPHLIPYIEGRWPRPSREARKLISSWATMFAMVTEFSDARSRVVPFVERQVFHRDQRPPIGAHVLAGRLAGDLPYWFHRRALRLTTDAADDTGPANGQLTTITLGHLLLQVYLTTSDLPAFDPSQRALEQGLSPLWPMNLKSPGHHRLPIRDGDAAKDFAKRYAWDSALFGVTEGSSETEPP